MTSVGLSLKVTIVKARPNIVWENKRTESGSPDSATSIGSVT